MNKFTRILTVALAAAVGFGVSGDALAEPTETSDEVSFQVYSGNLDAFVEAGSFESISMGTTESVGSLSVRVTDGRAPDGDWRVSASMTGFDGDTTSAVLSGAEFQLTVGTVTTGPNVRNDILVPGATGSTFGLAKQLLAMRDSPGAGAVWNASWTATVINIPAAPTPDTYSATISITISGDDF